MNVNILKLKKESIGGFLMLPINYIKCIICGEENINRINILDNSICHQCETEIIYTNPKDISYSLLLDKLKMISVEK